MTKACLCKKIIPQVCRKKWESESWVSLAGLWILCVSAPAKYITSLNKLKIHKILARLSFDSKFSLKIVSLLADELVNW